jgi:hypothetical protein
MRLVFESLSPLWQNCTNIQCCFKQPFAAERQYIIRTLRCSKAPGHHRNWCPMPYETKWHRLGNLLPFRRIDPLHCEVAQNDEPVALSIVLSHSQDQCIALSTTGCDSSTRWRYGNGVT